MSEVEETARFVSIFDKFFDSLNVNNNMTNGRNSRKFFKQPYRTAEDSHLKVCSVHSCIPPIVINSSFN